MSALGLFWKGALGSIPKLWERATEQSAHQHRRSENSAQTWLDTTAQSQRPSDTRTMDLSDRLPIWPPPRNPSTFLAQQRCSAAKGAWVRVECLPLDPPPHTQTTTRDQQQPTLMKTEKKWPNSSGIYITETERMKEPVQTVRGFLTFGTIAFYLGFLQDGSWLPRWEPRVINKALA